MQNTATPLSIGAKIEAGGQWASLVDGSLTPPIIVRGVIPQSVIEAEYRRGMEAIQSPTSDLLPTLAVKTVEADPSGQHVLVTTASEVTLMSQTGAVQDTFKCTGCGTLNHAVFGPNSVGDSLEIYIGGSLKYRRIGNEVSVEALAAREYQDRGVMFGTPVVVDSAGYGDFWNIGDASAAMSVVKQFAGYIRRGTYAAATFAYPGQTWIGESDSLTVFDGGIAATAVTITGAHTNISNIAAKTTPGSGSAFDAFYFNAHDITGSNLRAIQSDDDCYIVNGERIMLTGLRGSNCDDEGMIVQAASDRSIFNRIFIKDQGGTSVQVDAGAVSNVIDTYQLDGSPTDAGTLTAWGDGSSAGY